jgi:hypothetical protein
VVRWGGSDGGRRRAGDLYILSRNTPNSRSLLLGHFPHPNNRGVIVIKVTKQAGRRGVAFSMPWEGMAQEIESSSTACCEYDIIVIRISAKVSEHQFPGVVYEGGSQLATGTPTVGIGV